MARQARHEEGTERSDPPQIPRYRRSMSFFNERLPPESTPLQSSQGVRYGLRGFGSTNLMLAGSCS